MDARLTIAALLLLAACGGPSPFPGDGTDDGGDGDGGDGGGSETITVPESLAVNVTGVKYDKKADQLRVAITGIDSTPQLVTYERYAKLDVPGYHAFKIQEDSLDRMFVALAAEAPDGKTRAVTVADGGQFAYYFGGGYYERTGAFSRPNIKSSQGGTGQVTYAGRYGAVQNVEQDGSPDALPVKPGTEPGLVPRQPRRVKGDVFINANFADNVVNGTVYNRRVVGTGERLERIILAPTEITEQGTFLGDAEAINDEVDTITGNYGGVFGGKGSTSVAGLVHLEQFDDDMKKEQEHGVFVLTKCGQPKSAAVCDQVAPRN
ncbi:thymidylate synthase [Gemmobacter serpentinus]|uniref:thymidylate synthase n=1 Tax=Gemmobacter serpentinus TaxID=2652247 RepID=UPI00124D9683|nr:thymidylate synthase [Gemmobacter serpentinus]